MTTSISVERRRLRARLAQLALSTILCSGVAVPAFAQSTPTPEKPITDANGVDLGTGTLAARSKSVSVGNLAFNDIWSGTVDENTFTNLVFSNGLNASVVFIDGKSLRFVADTNGVFQPELANGATLTTNTNGDATYTSPEGARYDFVASVAGTVGATQSAIGVDGSYARLSKITYANGETRTWNYRIEQVSTGCGPRPGPNCTTTTYQRPQSVTTNTGLMLKTTFASQTPGADFNKLTAVTAINLGVDYCDPNADQCGSLSQTWPTLSISQTTDNTGLVQKVFASPSGEFLARLNANGPVDLNHDNAGNADFTVTRYPDGKIYQVTNAGVTTTYTYTQSGNQLTVTRTQPNNVVNTYVIDAGKSRLTSDTDALGRVTAYEYNSEDRLYKTTYPEGDQLLLTYDPLGRVTETRRKAKPGSSLADIVTTAGYTTNCTVETLKSCMKPLWTVDARGNRTDYTYSADHADPTVVRLPAPATGRARPKVDYTYTQLFAKVKNASGSLVDAASPVWKLTGVNQCASAATCAGSVNEQVSTVSYGTGVGGMNLLPTQVTVAAGDGSLSATTSYAYDASDNIVSVDGPLAGAADTSFYFWDADKRPIGVIGADPDGAGPLKRRAVRYTYSGDNLIETAIGTATGTDSAALSGMTVLQTSTATFDANNYKLKETIQAGGTTYALNQYSYDDQGRRQCSAVRMNTAAFASLPSSACTLGTTGVFGPDRISKTTYDAAGQVTKVQSAYGTADQADDATGRHTSNGQLATLTDANANTTTYEYDGVDRLSKTRYPVTTAGSGSSSTTDYEQLSYDTGSNVIGRRLRDATSIGYGYDALKRLVTKDLPGSEPDVSYAYDLLGRPVSAATSAQTLSFTYDALGRNLTQTGPLGTMTSAYDLAGRRTRLTWPDAFSVTPAYLVTGEVATISDNASTPLALATYGYDDLGRRTSLTLGNGTTTTYTPDAVSRLSSLGLNLAGTSNDLTLGFSYNPASQIASATRSNDGYTWTAAANRNDANAINGLNQVTSVGAASIGYDTRGNLTSNGSSSYTYSSENLLLTGPSSAALIYDPLLRLYQESSTTTPATRFLYDEQAMVAEYNSGGTLQKRYVHGPGNDEPLVEYDASGTRTWLHADERGSIIARSDDGGAKTAINSYDEYGVPATINVGRFGYTGQAWLRSLGLSYYKARMYAPNLGRFMQTDPIGYGDGLNRYAYVRGDSVNATDPSGLLHYEYRVREFFYDDGESYQGYGVGYYVLVPDAGDFSNFSNNETVGNVEGGASGNASALPTIPPRTPMPQMRKTTCEKIKAVGDFFLKGGQDGTSLATDIGALGIVGAPFSGGATLGLLAPAGSLLEISGGFTLVGDVINSGATGNYGPLIYNQLANTAKGVLKSNTAKIIAEIVGARVDESILKYTPYECK